MMNIPAEYMQKYSAVKVTLNTVVRLQNLLCVCVCVSVYVHVYTYFVQYYMFVNKELTCKTSALTL